MAADHPPAVWVREGQPVGVQEQARCARRAWIVEWVSGQGVAAHLSLKGENGSGGFAVEGGAETRDGLSIYDLRLAGHIQF